MDAFILLVSAIELCLRSPGGSRSLSTSGCSTKDLSLMFITGTPTCAAMVSGSYLVLVLSLTLLFWMLGASLWLVPSPCWDDSMLASLGEMINLSGYFRSYCSKKFLYIL